MPEHFSSYHKLLSILFLKENESTFQVMAMYRENADGLKYFRSAGLKCFDFCLLFPLVELEYRLKISSNSEQLLLCFVSIKTEYSCPRHSIHVALHKIRLNITTKSWKMVLCMYTNEPWGIWWEERRRRRIPTFIILQHQCRVVPHSLIWILLSVVPITCGQL